MNDTCTRQLQRIVVAAHDAHEVSAVVHVLDVHLRFLVPESLSKLSDRRGDEHDAHAGPQVCQVGSGLCF